MFLLAISDTHAQSPGDVLINEVVTDPQNDWSTTGFNGVITGGGSISTKGADEWIELYITKDNLNLTDWTIEIEDASGPFSGDLTDTGSGAFQVVNYVGAGSFTNTQAGDYLVLGNPKSDESMTNDVFIVLKDNGGTIIDDVEIGDDIEGDGPGDGAHDGTASGGDAQNSDEESVARIANGTDTDVDIDDFQQVKATMGAENGLAIVFVDATVANDNGLGISGNPKKTITSGIKLALTGGTVNVAAGTYAETLAVNKAITLNGANQGTSGTGSRSGEAIIEPTSAGDGITITASDVVVDGFQLGTNNTTSNIVSGVASSGNTGITVRNNRIFANASGLSIENASSGTISVSENSIELLNLENPFAATNPSIGMLIRSMTGSVDADFANNSVTGASYGILGYELNASPAPSITGGAYTGCTKGIEIDNINGASFAPSTANISDVTMSGFTGPDADLSQPDAQAGIYSFVSGSATAADDINLTIDNVDISGVENGDSDYSGIYLGDFATDGIGINYVVTNSNIHDNMNRGVFATGADATVTISNTSIVGNGFNPKGTGGNPGFSIITRKGAEATLTQCTISNAVTQSSFTTEGLHAALGGKITVSNSSIVNNGNGRIAQGITGGTLNLSGNWLGTSDEATIQALISSNNIVDITPWLNNSTDTDLATEGFQPDLSSVTVSASGAQSGSTDRLQEAHDLIAVDGTINALQANYAELLTVTKNSSISSEASTTIDNLTLNGGNLNVLTDLIVNNTLTLTDGILDTDLEDGDKSDDPQITFTTLSGTFGTNSHIEGKVTRAITAGGSFDFPVGDEGAYRPVQLNPTNAATFSVAFIADTPPSGAGTNGDMADLIGDVSSVLTGDIQSVLNTKYWSINTSDTPGSTALSLETDATDNISDPSTLGIIKFDGSDWTEVSGISTAGTGPYTISTSLSTFSDLSIYSTDKAANPLPVELINFRGIKHDQGIELVWETATEINSDYFQIERKFDGENQFKILGKVSSGGNTNNLRHYSFVDNMYSKAPLAFYRLKMVDFDGSYEYSSVILIVPHIHTLSSHVYPNPASDQIRVGGINPDQISSISVADLQGRVIKTNLGRIAELPVSDLVHGHYLLIVRTIDNQKLVYPFVKN